MYIKNQFSLLYLKSIVKLWKKIRFYYRKISPFFALVTKYYIY